jgi:hypothetical protein
VSRTFTIQVQTPRGERWAQGKTAHLVVFGGVVQPHGRVASHADALTERTLRITVDGMELDWAEAIPASLHVIVESERSPPEMWRELLTVPTPRRVEVDDVAGQRR